MIKYKSKSTIPRITTMKLQYYNTEARAQYRNNLKYWNNSRKYKELYENDQWYKIEVIVQYKRMVQYRVHGIIK